MRQRGKGPGRPETGARGRRRRDTEWTYVALLDALLGLISEGGREPTRKAIAERAGVSERTVFVHVADREALYVAAARRQAERWRAHAEPVPPGWEAARKVDALLAQRGLMYEVMSPIRTFGLPKKAGAQVGCGLGLTVAVGTSAPATGTFASPAACSPELPTPGRPPTRA